MPGGHDVIPFSFFSFKVLFNSQFLWPCDDKGGQGITRYLSLVEIGVVLSCPYTSGCIACWELQLTRRCIKQGVDGRAVERCQTLAWLAQDTVLTRLRDGHIYLGAMCSSCLLVLAGNSEVGSIFPLISFSGVPCFNSDDGACGIRPVDNIASRMPPWTLWFPQMQAPGAVLL